MKKTCAAVLAISMAMVWMGGCQEEQASSDVKQSRLIAAENGDLKAQLQQETKKRDEEIKNLKTQLQTEKEKLNADMNNLSKQLAKCVQERQAALDKAEKESKKLSEMITEETIMPLMKETGELKAEIAKLKAELSNCEGKK